VTTSGSGMSGLLFTGLALGVLGYCMTAGDIACQIYYLFGCVSMN
jgi:hypothetical protein